MKCLVFSDSHGSADNILSALKLHPDAEYAFFLGDGIRDIDGIVDSYTPPIWYAVLGNCDFLGYLSGVAVKKTEELTLFGKKIVLTHGDLYGAKYGLSGLERMAEARGADIVLYGHTHVPSEDYISVNDRGVYFFNPGSISTSYSNKPCFGILTIDENGVLFSHKSFP